MLSKVFDRPIDQVQRELEVVDETQYKHAQDIHHSEDWVTGTCDKGKGYFIWTEPEECDLYPQFAKKLVCNKEWCSDCGKDGSIAHNRRFLRWLPKIRQFESLGYFVFTCPEDIRQRYRSKDSLSKLGHGVQVILKRHGFSRGLRRFHYFGDESEKWHPHLNLLVESGFIGPEELAAIKAEYAALLGVPFAVVNYEYTDKPGKMVHILKYVTRATFHDANWDKEMAQELRKFRNMVVWGLPDRLDKETGEIIANEWRDKGGILADNDAVWSMDDLDSEDKSELEEMNTEAILSIGAGECPGIDEDKCQACNHRQLKPWSQALPLQLFDVKDFTELGAGYYCRKTKGRFSALSDDSRAYLQAKKQQETKRYFDLMRKVAKDQVTKWFLDNEHMDQIWKEYTESGPGPESIEIDLDV